MKRFWCLGGLLFCFSYSIAQGPFYSVDPGIGWVPYETAIDTRNEFNSKLAYSVMQSDELNWQSLSISQNGEKQDVFGRYNPLTDEIEIKDSNKIYNSSKQHNLKVHFIETNVTYQVKSYYGHDDKIYTGYFIIDSSKSDIDILKRESYRGTGKYSKTRLDGTIPFEKFETYYIIDDNNELFHLTTNRSIIRQSFPNHASLIIRYIRKNKLRQSQYDDIIELAKYIMKLRKAS